MINNRIFLAALTGRLACETELSMEASEPELEYVWYAHLENLDVLQSIAAEVIRQDQVEYRLLSKDGKNLGTMRTRKTEENVVLTIKVYNKDAAGCIETSSVVDNDMHDVFQGFADRRLVKTRYVLPVEVVHGDEVVMRSFEVDVFERPDGSIEPWVKIDFEVPDAQFPVPSLPDLFSSSEVINASFGQRVSAEDRQRIDEIYNRVRTQLN